MIYATPIALQVTPSSPCKHRLCETAKSVVISCPENCRSPSYEVFVFCLLSLKKCGTIREYRMHAILYISILFLTGSSESCFVCFLKNPKNTIISDISIQQIHVTASLSYLTSCSPLYLDFEILMSKLNFQNCITGQNCLRDNLNLLTNNIFKGY